MAVNLPSVILSRPSSLTTSPLGRRCSCTGKYILTLVALGADCPYASCISSVALATYGRYAVEQSIKSEGEKKPSSLLGIMVFIIYQIFHLDDGPEQQARDANMRSAMLDPGQGDFEGNQNQWADHKKNAEQFG